MFIPQPAVEAAADAKAERARYGPLAESHRDEARFALEAAYPAMRAATVDEVVQWLRASPEEMSPSFWAVAASIESGFPRP